MSALIRWKRVNDVYVCSSGEERTSKIQKNSEIRAANVAASSRLTPPSVACLWRIRFEFPTGWEAASASLFILIMFVYFIHICSFMNIIKNRNFCTRCVQNGSADVPVLSRSCFKRCYLIFY